MKKALSFCAGILAFLLVLFGIMALLSFQAFSLNEGNTSSFLYFFSDPIIFYYELLFLFALLGAVFGFIFFVFPQIKQKGKWSYMWAKTLIFAIPLLALILWSPLYWTFGWIETQPFYEFSGNAGYILLCFILGLVIVCGLKKSPEEVSSLPTEDGSASCS